jgi:hypothetical protein
MSVVDSVLEDIIPEDLLLELPEIKVVDIRIECSNKVSSASLLARLEVGLRVCPGTSDPEGPLAPKGFSSPYGYFSWLSFCWFNGCLCWIVDASD